MLLSIILALASLNPSSQVQAREYVTINVENHVMLARMYALGLAYKLEDPQWLRLYGPNRMTHQMIDHMLAKQNAEWASISRVPYKPEPGTIPYTLDEAKALGKALAGAIPDHISIIMAKFEAERALPKRIE